MDTSFDFRIVFIPHRHKRPLYLLCRPDLVKTVAEEFQAVPAKLLSRNLESSTRLADLMAGCTDSFTSAAVQEHLR